MFEVVWQSDMKLVLAPLLYDLLHWSVFVFAISLGHTESVMLLFRSVRLEVTISPPSSNFTHLHVLLTIAKTRIFRSFLPVQSIFSMLKLVYNSFWKFYLHIGCIV